MTASSSRRAPPDADLPTGLSAPLSNFLDDLQTGSQLAPNTVDAYRRDVERFVRALHAAGIPEPSRATPEHVGDLLADLHRAGLSPPTIGRNLTSIKSFYRFLGQHQPGHPDPTAGLEAPRQERRLPEPLSVDEIAALLDAPDPATPLGRRDRALLELLYATGMRVSEAIALQLDNLLLDADLVRLISRGPRQRFVPVGRRAVERARDYLQEVRPRLAGPASGDTVFLNARGGALSRMGLWKINRAAADKAGLQRKISPHTLRHSFAAHLLDGGANLRDVQELLGHSDLATTQVYARMDSRYLKEVHQTYHPRG